MFKIEIHLPNNRRLPGYLRLYNEDGNKLLYDIPCRAKADSGKARRRGNPDRDPTKPWGDAPAGRYKPVQVTRFDTPRKTVGAIVIWLQGISGDALRAKENGRTGLAIHGNRGNERLVATYGCTRLFDRDMELLARAIGDAFVQVEIFEHSKWPPNLKGENDDTID